MTWITPRQWRSIGGPPDPERMVWIDTGSGSGIEVPASQAHRFTVPPFATGTLSGGCPDPATEDDPPEVPSDVQVDAFEMLLARHTPGADGRCVCGRQLGEDTGLCYYGRQAQAALLRLTAVDGPPDPDVPEPPT